MCNLRVLKTFVFSCEEILLEKNNVKQHQFSAVDIQTLGLDRVKLL